MAATLDRDDFCVAHGTELPPLWHWMLFAPAAPARELGEDGHPRRGGFLPPVPLPRRMWAGGRLEFRHALRIGEPVERRSRIADVRVKSGRSGSLVFVTVAHEVHDADGLALTEEQDIVYRDLPSPDAPAVLPQPAPAEADFSQAAAADPVLLFRYSALTFNGHRIHYDRPYATDIEGYPGLVVHGPLIATLLLEQVSRRMPGRRVARFAFKAVRPLFDLHRFELCGRAEADGSVALWARDHEGWLAMQAEARLS